MTGPGPNPVLLRTAFSKFCDAEVAVNGRGPGSRLKPPNDYYVC
jgi:hypothetical protein